MSSSAFVFATDLADEGVDRVLDNVKQAGLGGITAAFAYHEARDVFPHNPARRVSFLQPGALYFRPTPELWADTPIEPVVSGLAHEPDPLPRARERTAERELALHAWAVFLHTDRRDDAVLPHVCRNAFGDPYRTDLCPASDGARSYARALAADIAGQGVDSILSESLHYHPLEHGFHHERYFLELAPRTRFLLGLCFCEGCLERARTSGVDGERLRAWAAAEIDAVFAGADQPAGALEWDEMGAEADGELAGYLAMRNQAVSSLVEEVSEAAQAGGASLTFLDLSGGVKGYATGRPEGGPAASIAWQLGIDVAEVAQACGSLGVVGYAADPARVNEDLEAYRALVAGASLTLALRPSPPDCASAANLLEKLRVARQAQVERVDFYHYGLVPLSALELVQEALAAV